MDWVAYKEYKFISHSAGGPGGARSKGWQSRSLMSVGFLLHGQLCPPRVQGVRELSEVSLIRALIPFTQALALKT